MTVRTPAAGDKVSIVLPNRTIPAEVVEHSPQTDFHSQEAPAVIVKIEGVLNTFAHKSKFERIPYWEWPVVVEEAE